MDDSRFIKCEECMAHYLRGSKHECPPWLKALVTMNKAKKQFIEDIKSGKVKKEELPF